MTKELRKAIMNRPRLKKIDPLEKSLKTRKNKKINVINFLEKRTILRVSQKTI